LIPVDYDERVYAGVLGKAIGVYLGRPVEGWSYERITEQIGTISGYVHDRVGMPLVVTDDDISGTFTFFRALEDSGYDPNLSSEAIGQAWLNYIIEDRTILWWGGLGHSTEHTAYLRLKAGITPPRSGSAALNGRVVAEQIGSQIFIDGWGLASPGDPDRAATFARRAASVSHDGVAIDAAVLIAVMEAMAFVEPTIDTLLDVGLSFVAPGSAIAQLASDLRALRQTEPDWRVARAWLASTYGSDRFKGNVHVVPNHGLILLSLLWGDDDFTRTLSIVNTSGWDTDCNSGNVGCLMGIKNGLAGIDGSVDWRGPIADRLFLPTAEGGRAITDAAIEADRISAAGRRLAGLAPIQPKGGARFHFTYPGSVQGFEITPGTIALSAPLTNVPSPLAPDERVLRVPLRPTGTGPTVVATDTFIRPEDRTMPGYRLIASPSLYPGQTVEAKVILAPEASASVDVAITVAHYGGDDSLAWIHGPVQRIHPGASGALDWVVPDTGGQPVAKVGLRVTGKASDSIHIDRLSWSGEPTTRLGTPADGGSMWRRAWVDGMDIWNTYWDEPFRLSHNEGIGLISQGTLEWRDYEVVATLTPHQARGAGIAARVGGRRRWYALFLVDGAARLVRCKDELVTLAERSLEWDPYTQHVLMLSVRGSHIRGWIDGALVCDVRDESLVSGAVGLILDEGTMLCDEIEVRPAIEGTRRSSARVVGPLPTLR